MSLFSECVTSTDCHDGGMNFKCTDNKCECPIPWVLDGQKCVGTLVFEINTVPFKKLFVCIYEAKWGHFKLKCSILKVLLRS